VSKPLIPPDYDCCQAEKPAGHSFMTLGGVVGAMVRCTNKPAFIVSEVKPGKDGQCGSMSLCTKCLEVFKKQVGGEAYMAEYRVTEAIKPLTTAELLEAMEAASSSLFQAGSVHTADLLRNARALLERYEKARADLSVMVDGTSSPDKPWGYTLADAVKAFLARTA